MGYDSGLDGELLIEPPLRWAEYRDSEYFPADVARDKNHGVCLVETRETVDTEDGPLERRTAVRVVFAYDYRVKLYDIVADLQALVDAHPGHQFTGEFRGSGYDFGDIWLLRVNADRKVERVLPTITWPDGTVLVNERYQHEQRRR